MHVSPFRGTFLAKNVLSGELIPKVFLRTGNFAYRNVQIGIRRIYPRTVFWTKSYQKAITIYLRA